MSKVQKKFQKNPAKRLTYFQYVVQLKRRNDLTVYITKNIGDFCKMSNTEIAKQVIDAIGGVENVSSVAHCATRLRVMVKMNQKSTKMLLRTLKSTGVLS